MFKFLSQLLDFIYKKRCYFCGSTIDNVKMCKNCFENIELLPAKTLKTIHSVSVFCATVYENKIQKLIRGIKYHNQKELAFYQAKIMYNYWQRLTTSEDIYEIVPVPLYPDREKKRKYNQMVLVAQEFSKLTGYKTNVDIIKRVKNTKPQYKLTKKEREKNLKDAFECDMTHFHGQKLLLIDDILTTGSTMEEMIKTFQKAGITDLSVFVTSCTKYNLD